ncbi:serine phosphatase RsbU (regulator of sigma subunit) [Streptomyces sp. CG 926]|uniref:SpoIIE family protein phosphatase n=1 Tax=Streptomyces sp. CG 926 TaxID=1882405 RepID=UPI000D6C6152|nr:SpoIIE family protein phosphatase [Streptomyces sp. CG 926]PWK71199.1 serine phosphatase RsbU (regulator of sigma subunit) [Streptomyces sp. CG 926]
MGVVGDRIGPVRFRDRFLQGESVEGSVRSPILSSWQRSRLLGLSPDQSELPFEQDVDLEAPLLRAAEPVLDRLQAIFAGSRTNICLADGHGMVLARRFGEKSMVRHLAPIQILPGFVFAERVAGTNGIGLSLAERRLCQVYGAEHFAERSQASACTAIPLRDQLSGHIQGVLCLGYPYTDADPALIPVVRKAAEAIERRLMDQSSAREHGLLQAYLDAAHLARSNEHGLDGHPVAMADFLQSELEQSDQASLKEKATELMSGDRRAAAEVPLSRGRWVTLVSRPVTSAAGVEGVVVEALLPEDTERHAPAPTHPHAPAAVPPAFRPHVAPGPSPATVRARGAPPADDPARDGRVRGLVLVGEPEVGKYAVAARRRLELLAEASNRIGTTLDVSRTAWELAETAVPRLADFITIDMPGGVLLGEESPHPTTEMHRTVVHGIREDCPFYPVGSQVSLRPTTPHMRCVATGQPVLEQDLKGAFGWIAQDPEHAELLLAHNIHSLITVPLLARGTVLGVVSFYRSQDPSPYGDDDRSLAQELAARAALCIDNARRYTREHTLALSLQRSLLPRGLPEQSAVEVAHRYLPAESGVGGDWFDVIPLSGARVALLVGDVVGHGLHAAATMGRLRTAARNFAELELAPDELLTHLDNLMVRLDREEGGDGPDAGSTGIVGATCLYAIYDPTSQQCTMARAGHPPPALVRPDGAVSLLDLPAGPPLGLGGLPFESVEVRLPEHSQLVLYTDGLIDDRHRDVDVALDALNRALAHPDRTPEETCQAVLDAVAPEHPDDDIALLVARTHAVPTDRIAAWELDADPARVSEVRAACVEQLNRWGLEESTFATELLLSELVTNAVRYGTAPIRVRLIHDRNLICEVHDASSSAPRMRRSATTDEGGRGLFLVAQLAQSWGTRYTTGGKVIWAECSLAAA